MIDVKNLTKVYGGTVKAVNDISFTVTPGKICGFLGPNGAGKTTTMNIITGYIAPTSGSVTINGYDIYKDANKAKQCIGYLPEQPPLYNELTPYEYLKVAAGLKNIPKADRHGRIREVMEQTGISDVSDRLIFHLSKGYRQRVGLAQALLGDPEVVILDEPTVGLDPKQIIEIRDLISNLRNKHTVLLSSHILSEISATCDTVMIISKGRIVASDTLENLSAKATGNNILKMTLKGEREKIESAFAPFREQAALEISPSMQESGAYDIKIESAEQDLREPVFYAMCENKLPILAMSKIKMSLEEVFLDLTSQDDEYDDEYYDDEESREEYDEYEGNEEEFPNTPDDGIEPVEENEKEGDK